MNIETRGQVPKGQREEKLFIGGREVGTVKIKDNPAEEGIFSANCRYHVAFYVCEGLNGFLQGHGDTVEEAVREAIAKGRAGAIERLEAIEALEAEMLYGGESK